MVAVFFLGSAPGLVTARQDWSERMAPRASGDTRVERAIKRGEERGPTCQQRCALWRAPSTLRGPHASEDAVGCCALGLERSLSFSGI